MKCTIYNEHFNNFIVQLNNKIHENRYSTNIDETTYMPMEYLSYVFIFTQPPREHDGDPTRGHSHPDPGDPPQHLRGPRLAAPPPTVPGPPLLLDSHGQVISTPSCRSMET